MYLISKIENSQRDRAIEREREEIDYFLNLIENCKYTFKTIKELYFT